MNTSQALLKAADLLERKGWTQNVAARDVAGQSISCASKEAVCYCVDGAIQAVTVGSCTPYTDWAQTRATLRDYLDIPSLIVWNDNPRRTKEEVIVALREAAK